MKRLPPPCRLILRALVPARHRDDAAGDLAEVHMRRVARWGRMAGWFLTVADALQAAAVFQGYRVSDALRSVRGLTTRTEFLQSFRVARRQPLASVTMLFALSIGIGLAHFGLVLTDAMVFSQLPYEQGDRFVRVDANDPRTGRGEVMSLGLFHLLAERATSLDHLGAKDHEQMNLLDGAGAVEQVTGVAITPGSFAFLPATPLRGRTLAAADGEPGAVPVAVIRQSLWQSHYGGRDDVIGSPLNVDGISRRVVGVLPDEFRFPNSPVVWVPLGHRFLGGTAEGMPAGVEVFGVRTEGRALADARDEIERLSSQYALAEPTTPDRLLTVLPYTQETTTAELWMVLGPFVTVLVLVLLVIAFNVGNLVMVRTASRASELAVRTALGASRIRILGQLCLEVAVLVGLATLLGLVASLPALAWLQTAFTDIPYWLQLQPSLRTVLAVGALALLAMTAAGLLPALRATRATPGEALRAGGRGPGRLRLGRVGASMIALQMAVSIAFVGTALLTARTALALVDPDLDVPRGEVLTAQVRIDPPAPPPGMVEGIGAWQTNAITTTRTALLDAARRVPGVGAVGAASALPGQSPEPRLTAVEPMPGAGSRVPRPAPVVAALPGFLEAVGAVPVVGRSLTDADFLAGAPRVAVVNTSFVEKFLDGQSPLGRRIATVDAFGEGNAVSEPEWREVVGVVKDLGLSVTDPAFSAGYYVPLGARRQVELAVRVDGEPMAYAGLIRGAVVSVDPTATFTRVRLLEDVSHEEAIYFSLWGSGLVVLGMAALVLSLAGMYAITALAVTERTREIGVRLALGANASDIGVLVARHAIRSLVVGAVAGTALGFGLLRVTASLAGGLGLGAPIALVPVALALTLAGALACWLPVRRALRIDPLVALRD